MAKLTALTAFLAISATFATAHQCSHDLAERGLASHKARRAAHHLHKRAPPAVVTPTDQASEAAIKDPAQACAAYYYNLKGKYPPVWEIAHIVPGDTAAQSLFKMITSDPKFPNLPLKGDPTGVFFNNYSVATDPDCWWSATTCVTPSAASGLPADVFDVPEPHTWALTYDDGPNCTHFPLYDMLKAQKQTATMFYVGSNVADWPYQAQRGLADGHEIAVHTWSHRYSTGLTNEQIFAELYYTKAVIKEVIGVTPTTWRPPFGDIDNRIRFIAEGLGLTTILWRQDVFDWQVQPAGPLPTASVLDNYQKIFNLADSGEFNTHGAIVLSHEINGDTMNIAVQEYPNIKKHFKYVAPVTVCRNITKCYANEDIEFPTFADYIQGDRSDDTVATTGLPLASPTMTRVLKDPTATSGASPQAQQTGSNAGGNSATSTALPLLGLLAPLAALFALL